MRIFNGIDKIIIECDAFIRALTTQPITKAARPSPALATDASAVPASKSKQVAGLMRVNLAGEICAQALYRAHALTARSIQTKEQMHSAALEEIDHLVWCQERLAALNATPSILNPLWYAGAFFIGILAGLISDAVSLGFVIETEKQVSEHLHHHLQQLENIDKASYAVVEQMYHDELAHAKAAEMAGGITFPYFMQKIMQHTARIMTKTSYFI